MFFFNLTKHGSVTPETFDVLQFCSGYSTENARRTARWRLVLTPPSAVRIGVDDCHARKTFVPNRLTTHFYQIRFGDFFTSVKVPLGLHASEVIFLCIIDWRRNMVSSRLTPLPSHVDGHLSGVKFERRISGATIPATPKGPAAVIIVDGGGDFYGE